MLLRVSYRKLCLAAAMTFVSKHVTLLYGISYKRF